jgi:hypothetical protein
MINIIKISGMVLIIIMTLSAESKVFTSESLPCRIVCKSEWVEQERNDSVLFLKNSTPGKKTRLQLKKYVTDTGYDTSNNEWSRWRYAINTSMIDQFGKIGFSDSTSGKKLGGYRAFEIFAFYWEKTDAQTLWWAEYIRWTDFNGIGYMAQIIGDTLDMKENVINKNYVNMLDSITFSLFATKTKSPETNSTANFSFRQHTAASPDWYDFLGRNLRSLNYQKPDMIIVKKNIKRCIVR